MINTKYISYHSHGKTHALVPHTKIPLTLHICPPKKTVNVTQHICPPPFWRSNSPEGIPGCKSEEKLRPQHSAAPRSGSHLQKYLFIFTRSSDLRNKLMQISVLSLFKVRRSVKPRRQYWPTRDMVQQCVRCCLI